MNPFRLLPKSLKRRMFRYTPSGFPDPASCGAFYDARNTLFSGDDMMVLEYSGVEAQQRLFERATALLPPEGSVLDLGCGLGHLALFFDEHELQYAQYHGIDVSPRMVDDAMARHRERGDLSFARRDILEQPLDSGSFDSGYILSVLGYPIGSDPASAMMAILANAFSACRSGVVFSHIASGRKDGLNFTTVPEAMAERCEKDLGARVTIDDDGSDFTYLVALRH